MAGYNVVGIDWATEPKNRAIASIHCDETGRLEITKVGSPLDNDHAITACRRKDVAVVAVDIPFGWPLGFRQFVGEWSPGASPKPPSSESFRYRLTDLIVKKEARKSPLSVSSNLIAVGTRQWLDVCHGQSLEAQVDVLGKPSSSRPRIIEVYPGGTLTAFAGRDHGLLIDGYKSDESIRQQMLLSLCRRFSLALAAPLTMEAIVGKGGESDQVDAIVAAITGLLYAVAVLKQPVGQHAPAALTDWAIRCPQSGEDDLARQEGWIFFPIPPGNEGMGNTANTSPVAET